MEPARIRKGWRPRNWRKRRANRAKKNEDFPEVFPYTGVFGRKDVLACSLQTRAGPASPEDDEKIISATYTAAEIGTNDSLGKTARRQVRCRIALLLRFLAPNGNVEKPLIESILCGSEPYTIL